MRYISALLLALFPVMAFAQGENDNWYFGSYAGVNFSGSNPVALTNSQLDGFEACGTASDANGNLLFYTDGTKIMNRQHQVMQNGSGLTGSPSTEQMAIVKNPSNANQYFVFTGGLNYSAVNIAYSIVDMSMGSMGVNGNPLGKVLDNVKNIQVVDNLGNHFESEAITIVPASNGTFWVLIPSNGQLYSFPLDNNGFHNGAPVISNLNFPMQTMMYNHFGIKASPVLNNAAGFSNYLCISSWANPEFHNKVLSFNNTTGTVTQDYSLDINSVNSYSPEFNKNGTILYMGFYNIYAIDLIGSIPPNVNFMQVYAMPANSYCGAIQRNKYDDIYVTVSGIQYLSKIDRPDVYGPNISFDLNNIDLGIYALTRYGLPQLLPQPYISPPVGCIDDTIVNKYETHFLYTYQASNTITTKDSYTVFPKQNITMKAGKYIKLMENTSIRKGATYLAKIENCKHGENPQEGKRQNRVSLFLELDKDVAGNNKFFVYPNPFTTALTVRGDKAAEGRYTFRLANVLGANVWSAEKMWDGRPYQFTVPAVLPQGIYFFQVVKASNILSTVKLVKK